MEKQIQKEIQLRLAKTCGELLRRFPDNPETRLFIAQYTMGYMGASFGLKIDG